MAKYTATKASGTSVSLETCLAALELALEAIDTGKNHLIFDITSIAGGRFAYWIAYTEEA